MRLIRENMVEPTKLRETQSFGHAEKHKSEEGFDESLQQWKGMLARTMSRIHQGMGAEQLGSSRELSNEEVQREEIRIAQSEIHNQLRESQMTGCHKELRKYKEAMRVSGFATTVGAHQVLQDEVNQRIAKKSSLVKE